MSPSHASTLAGEDSVEVEHDPTTARILDAALGVFGTHGFRAATMSQIAVDAGVSRPTLYARYPDKARLFRGVVQLAYDDALAAASATVSAGGPFSSVLEQTLLDYYGGLYDRFHGLPRIEELVGVQSEQATDIVDGARERMKRLLSRLIRKYAREGAIAPDRIGVPQSQLVELLRLTPLSLKPPGTSRTLYRAHLGNLAKIVAASIEGATV